MSQDKAGLHGQCDGTGALWCRHLELVTAYLDTGDGNGAEEEGGDASNDTGGGVGKEGPNLQAK